MSKSILEKIDEASKNELGDHIYPFDRGAIFAMNLLIEELESYHSDNGPYRKAQWWAEFLRNKINEGEKE